MKKTIQIALFTFVLGILIAGAIFVIIPEKNVSSKSFLEQKPNVPSYSSALFAAQDRSPVGTLDFVSIVEKVKQSVVRVEAHKVEKVGTRGIDTPFEDFWDRFFGIPREQERHSIAYGTGFFISPDGYILTNNHIAENSNEVLIYTYSGKEYKAEIVGLDSRSDLALLKVDDKNLSFIALGDSDILKVGEWVVAIGNPLGMTYTVTAGIVSAKGRNLSNDAYQNFIQTDAAINRGNSGGPLLNMGGEVIGINTLILAPSGGNIGIGFAIPANLAKSVIQQLKEKGRVIRGYLGVIVSPVNEEIKDFLKLNSKEGALVNSVESNTPADKAGIRTYDVIVEIDGVPVKDDNDLKFKIAEIEPGRKVPIEVIRDGKRKILEAKLTELDTEEEQETSSPSGKDLGIGVQELTPSLASRYRLQTKEGLMIVEIEKGSIAQRKGLLVGDIILEANRVTVTSYNQLKKVIDGLNPGDPLLLKVRRERSGASQDFLVSLRIPE
ncbi:MAG: Do family serine endopeptidase [Candidatus Aminicenantes bacterium]|nr:Do family serine endopeptidase [Candidatus Aminicenantes bacterium]